MLFSKTNELNTLESANMSHLWEQKSSDPEAKLQCCIKENNQRAA